MLEHYGIRGMPLKLFQNYLMNRTQFVEINKKSSDVLPINYGVPQGSVLGPLLFLIYINDLNGAVTHSKVHHFADDTNMLYISNSLKDTNRKVNYDLRHIVKWLRANKISINSSKTEFILFRSKHQNIAKNMNFGISGQKINIICKAKYLGLILDEHLTFTYHLENLKLKLNRANCLLSKIRYFVKFPLLRIICYALFRTHLRYGCQIWGKNKSLIVEAIKRTQNKVLRISNFKVHDNHYLCKESKIDKLKNIINKS